jgi:DNA-binding response OmpR family regulator
MDTSTAAHILCVEPDPASQALLEQALTGFHVVFAVDGYETMREINRHAFHAYVLEYRVPHWSGLSACREIRRDDPKVPILFCSTAGGDECARALSAGATDFVPKPIDPPKLRRKVRVMLELAELESRRAQVEEQIAIDEELRSRAADAIARTGLAKLAAARAIERSARAKALAQYLAGGGTRAHFEALWNPTFARSWALYDEPLSPP